MSASASPSRPPAVRAIVAEDERLLREAIVALLEGEGIEVVGQAGDVPQTLEVVTATRPDIAIIDVRMPPFTDEDGLSAARTIRQSMPQTAVMLLSSQITTLRMTDLIGDGARGIGYLLKDRVGGAEDFIESVRRVAAGGCVVDPEVVAHLLRPAPSDPVDRLTPREREVLALIAEGRSNSAIGQRLSLSPKTVETHIGHIFAALGIPPEPSVHRRVRAVLAYVNRGK
jgi:DNA-binding NarL/FixJ family response regulator